MLRTTEPQGVSRSPAIWGNSAVIAGSAIPVFMVEDLYNEAGRVEDVLAVYSWLSKAEVLRALAYAAEFPHLVAADRARHEEAARGAPGN